MRTALVTAMQVVLILVGLGAMTFLCVEPLLEGKNARATIAEIYLNDGLLAYAFAASIPFFAGLYQALKITEGVRRHETFSLATAGSLRWIRRCGIAVLGFVAFSVVFFVSADPEDRPAGLFMRLLVAAPAIGVVLISRALERWVRRVLGRPADVAD
jgi:hypothetical protein